MAIFVFGSNLRGIHGAGAANHAFQNEGAKWGVGVGPVGNSYAIPTKGLKIETLPLIVIKKYVGDFLIYARLQPNLEFNVTRIGCGLAGYSDSEIAPLFAGASPNCHLPTPKSDKLCKISWREINGE